AAPGGHDLPRLHSQQRRVGAARPADPPGTDIRGLAPAGLPAAQENVVPSLGRHAPLNVVPEAQDAPLRIQYKVPVPWAGAIEVLPRLPYPVEGIRPLPAAHQQPEAAAEGAFPLKWDLLAGKARAAA